MLETLCRRPNCSETLLSWCCQKCVTCDLWPPQRRWITTTLGCATSWTASSACTDSSSPACSSRRGSVSPNVWSEQDLLLSAWKNTWKYDLISRKREFRVRFKWSLNVVMFTVTLWTRLICSLQRLSAHFSWFTLSKSFQFFKNKAKANDENIYSVSQQTHSNSELLRLAC